jgi:hypothetical protein
MSPAADLRDRMAAAATRTPAPRTDAAPPAAPPRTPRVAPYKGTFEMSRTDAKRMKAAAFEHDTSVTRLVQAAVLTALDDPAVMAAVLRVVDRLAAETEHRDSGAA